MASNNRYKIKTNKNHGGKEFTSSFHFVGKIKPVKNQEKGTDNWVEVPFYRLEEEGKKKVLEFVIETALSNDLKLKLTGKEKDFVYPYSRKESKAAKISWEDRFDKEKYPNDTYHLIDVEWDKIDKLKELVQADTWVEVKGKYSPFEFTDEQNRNIKGFTRTINYINPIVDGKVKIGEELKPIKVNEKEITYVCDFESPDFVEVNTFNMQIGIKSTYQNENDKSTKVNAAYLVNGVKRSDSRDLELVVYYKETDDGNIPLADAFATLNRTDFIEVTGTDNNRATFGWVDIESSMDENDPFKKVSSQSTKPKKERVVNGEKKGLEITGFVEPSLMRNFLTEEEMKKTVEIEREQNPFKQDDELPVDISDDELPF
ncbi:hypothetical protein [Paenibacillus oleatilyticus]|uniref:hypothetical protein n=1 Tax=Paenibacillus oleatilyticus TaxID=2594886 RepID=UPI001C1F8111|nr:hypothetical protein [Paenibacillus oleatilyticus]MBU7316035.1 hypothetical protein [Paenibacillus oleatilyticus]